MNRAGLNIKVSGTGTVFRQQHEPGASVAKGSVVELEFRNGQCGMSIHSKINMDGRIGI